MSEIADFYELERYSLRKLGAFPNSFIFQLGLGDRHRWSNLL